MIFTGRHEQELAEIKALQQELGQRVTEALEQIGHIQEVHSRLVAEGIREEIDALATRYELAEGAADALEGLAGLVDWEQPNFLPESDPERRRRSRRRVGSRRLMASNVLAESLSGLELEQVRAARRVADIGSGAGFPGLVLAIALPRAYVTLIERVPERCSFLRGAIADLGVDNVELVEGDVQQWSEGVGKCDLVTSRKVGRLNQIVEWCAPLLAPGGAVAIWPGSSDFTREEHTTAAGAAEAIGLRLAHVHLISSKDRRGEPFVKHLYLYRNMRESLPDSTAARRAEELALDST